MKHLMMAGIALAVLSVKAHALDCAALVNATGTEPPGYAGQCLGAAGKAETFWPASAALLDELAQGYAAQINPTEGFSPQGMYRFVPDDFAGAQRIGAAADTVNIFGLDFNSAATRLYGAQVIANNGGTRLGTFDLQTGAFRPLFFLLLNGGFQLAENVTGLAIHPRTGEAWVSTVDIQTNNPQISIARLWRLNIGAVGATVSLVGNILPEELNPVVIDIAVNCDGDMYAHNITDDALYTIDPGTAEATLVGTHGLPANFAQGMDFDNATGELYAWIYTGGGENAFGRFNLETGAFASLSEGPTGQWEGVIDSQCEPATIDPDALTGAWYARYTNGQGFTARYYPESGTVFIPWFTFSQEGGEESDQQRWYSLSGTVDEDATEVNLPILQTLGGRFDQPPAVAPVQVGQARLSFYSCSEGVLEYQFDPGHNGGAQGRISMSRLLPLGEECTEFNGQTVEAQGEYDTDLTGSWYDPETSGQGLELYRIESTESVTGLLYGAWFTFEPTGETSDPSGQRWFTLQGQVVGEDGAVTTSILRTLDGSFDSEPANLPAPIGKAVFRSESCDELVMTYEFDDTESIGEFRDLSGEIVFRRLGVCQSEDE